MIVQNARLIINNYATAMTIDFRQLSTNQKPLKYGLYPLESSEKSSNFKWHIQRWKMIGFDVDSEHNGFGYKNNQNC